MFGCKESQRLNCFDFEFRAATGHRISSASGPSPHMDKREGAMLEVRLEGAGAVWAAKPRNIPHTNGSDVTPVGSLLCKSEPTECVVPADLGCPLSR